MKDTTTNDDLRQAVEDLAGAVSTIAKSIATLGVRATKNLGEDAAAAVREAMDDIVTSLSRDKDPDAEPTP